MTGPTDTIRQALDAAEGGISTDWHTAAMAALTQVEQQLDRMTKTAEELRRRWDDETARAVAAEVAHKRAFEENRQLASRNAALEDRAVAAETALAEANDDRDQLRELNRLFENDLHALLAKDEAAEQRANALADALRAIGPLTALYERMPTYERLRRIEAIARAALDRHTQ